MTVFDENWNGKEGAVALGESFEVRLPENPTTGFRWDLRSDGGPTLACETDTFEPPATDRLGAGGVRVWRFLGARAGIGTVATEYRRGWEQHAGRTFQLTVQVKPR